MKTEEFEKKMENLNKPSTDAIKPPLEIKLAIVNAQRSAALGLWFIVIPCFFLAGMIMKYEFQINLGILDTFAKIVESIDKNPAIWWIQPVFLIVLPITGVILNALALTHFRWDTVTKSIMITIKIRWINLITLAISLLIVSLFALYLIAENFQAVSAG